MKTPIFPIYLMMFLFLACGNAEQPDSETESKAAESTSVSDTIKPGKSVRNNRPNYIKDTARPVDEIQTQFPYDIQMKTADGKTHLSPEILDNDGKPLVLLFWLTTCKPCKWQMREMEKVYQAWQEETGVKLIAISTDFQKRADQFTKMVNEHDWPWDAYHDWNREFRRVMPGGLNGMPQTFLFDGNGNLVYHKRKYRPGDENILYDEIIKLGK